MFENNFTVKMVTEPPPFKQHFYSNEINRKKIRAGLKFQDKENSRKPSFD